MKLPRGRFPHWGLPIGTPLALFAVVLLSYGIWIPWMGLFGNDLPYLWYYHLLGPWGPGDFASIDRPFSAVFYAASTFILGETVWHYHVFLLLLRWLSAVLLWWVLKMVWPESGREAALSALLLAVYPGFLQNPVALEFILHFCVLDLFLLSLGASLSAVLQPGGIPRPIHPALQARHYWSWAVVSMVGAGGLFWLEYFIGLEILRPIFLWLVTRRQGLSVRQQWKRILAGWLPALGVVLAFIFWRVFVFSFRTYQPVLLDQLRAAPLDGLIQLGDRIVRDMWTSLGDAWILVFQFPQNRRWLLQDLALTGVCAGVIFFLLNRVRSSPVQLMNNERRKYDYWGEWMLGLGLVSMLAGGAIFWLTGIPVGIEFPWDRSTLSFMVGASLAGVGLLEMLVAPRYRLALIALLIGLAAGTHFQNAQIYRAEWKKLQSFFWQLTWRAPGLEPGTLILFDVIPLNRYSDNDLTALLNWTYAPDLKTRQIPYKFFDLTIRLNSEYEGLPGLEKGLLVEHNHRGLSFKTTTSNTIAVHYNPPGCLVVLGPADSFLPGLPGKLSDVLPMTDLNQIRAMDSPARPPKQLGEEPVHDWCYYYQKAGLARQQENWQKITELGDQAVQAGFRWNDSIELIPFIEGYACNGDWEKARQLTIEANHNQGLQPSLCATWKQICGQQGSKLQAVSAVMQTELGCTP